MSVQTSTINAAIAYLVAHATSAFPTALVFDGPSIVADQEASQDRITIGWDGDDDSFSNAVEGDQSFNALNRAVTRDEDYRIVCSVTHWDGAVSIAGARAAAVGLLATFEQLLRGYPPNGTGDVTLGGAVLWAHMAGGISMSYDTDDNFASCRIVFHVTCHARLTGA